MNLLLRPVLESDVRIFFAQQSDPIARQQVAYVVPNPDDWPTFQEKWERILSDQTAITRAIVVAEVVVGNVGCHQWYGKPEVGYWVGREYWGRGIATRALTELLREWPTRPVYAFTASDHAASQRMLTKCGFRECGRAKEYSHAREQEVEGIMFELTNGAPPHGTM
jgi:RimJ/RimL family protein N-acetyltransferase